MEKKSEKQILREVMTDCGWTQAVLAEKMGYASQSAVANRISGGNVKVDTFVKLLDCMGYEVVVRSKSPNLNKSTWIVGIDK